MDILEMIDQNEGYIEKRKTILKSIKASIKMNKKSNGNNNLYRVDHEKVKILKKEAK